MKLIEVDRSEFSLTVWMARKKVPGFYRERVYPVAIGRLGFDTPIGAYVIAAKAKNPDWKMPDSPWVKEEDRGKIVPGGDPANPLKAAFLDLAADGVGIHGTADRASIGTAASHGCIRMDVPDVLDLYGRVGVGCPVLIHD
jgi:lipoprotein-anchoring transpeptidase ErfK/SrfK